MKVLCCGSRGWGRSDLVMDTLQNDLNPFERHVILHGAASGADLDAGEAAHELGYEVRAFPADWKQHGRSAGPIRNRMMLDQDPDLVFAFWDGKSRGTLDTITEATRRGIRVEIIPAKLRTRLSVAREKEDA